MKKESRLGYYLVGSLAVILLIAVIGVSLRCITLTVQSPTPLPLTTIVWNGQE